MENDQSWEDILLGKNPVPIEFTGFSPWRLPEASGGTGVLIRTNLGTIKCLFHSSESSSSGIIWVSGAMGGYNGGGGLYPILSDELASVGITSIRLNYRKPNDLLNCMLDVVAGVQYLESQGCQKIALVGHSFGGAVVIASAPLSKSVVTVVGLASQTYGAQYVSMIEPRSLLLVHGQEDTRLGPHCSELIFKLAYEPKKLVLYPETGHSLRESQGELHRLLTAWLMEKLDPKPTHVN